jgi:uncharacterized protein YbjT (DUF2867 family)
VNILITGANGFVGKALMEHLIKDGHQITALVRKKKRSHRHDKVKWIEGDLSRPESLPVLGEIDKAYYLVHGLREDERLFEYEESFTAVNFINWIRPTGAGIIYLGALGPKVNDLSPHLRSRQLTGSILGSSGLSVIEFRASIVLGEGSLSFEMIKALAERFPVIPDVELLNRPCQPLALEDLLNYLEQALLLPNQGHQIFEIGGPEVATYGELLKLYADLSGIKRIKLKIPEIDLRVVRKILDYSLPEHSQIGKKLTDSLLFPTVVSNNKSKESFPQIHPLGLSEAMDKARLKSKTIYPPIWERDFIKLVLSDKLLSESGLFSPEVLKKLEKLNNLKNIITRKKV